MLLVHNLDIISPLHLTNKGLKLLLFKLKLLSSLKGVLLDKIRRSILIDSLSEIFGRTKLHKKRSRNKYFISITYESYRDFEVNFLVLR
jgi:hypothetical protein